MPSSSKTAEYVMLGENISFEDFDRARKEGEIIKRQVLCGSEIFDATLCVLEINQSNAEPTQYFVKGLLIFANSFQHFQIIIEKENGFREKDVITIFPAEGSGPK